MNSTWIQTFTGRHVCPASLDVNDVDICDIAHALSNMCRFTGHCRKFYSVAQHAATVASVVDEPFKKHAILHDACEAYLVDLPRPLRSKFPLFNQMEKTIAKAIFKSFGLDPKLPGEVVAADNAVLHAEAKALFDDISHWGFKGDPPQIDITPISPRKAEILFMSAYKGIFHG